MGELLIGQVVTELACKRDDLRVSFETVSPWLDQHIEDAAKWQVRALGRSFLGTVQWEAQLLRGKQVGPRLVIQARVTRKVAAVVCTGLVKKDDVIEASQVKAEERWVDRKVGTQFTDVKEVVGQRALRAIGPGSVLDQRDFKPEELAARGDAVTVHVIRGGLRIKTSGEAVGGGKLGDRITVKTAATGEKFEGTLIGPRAVVVGTMPEAKVLEKIREER